MHILYVTHGYKPAYRIGGPIWSVSATAEGMVARGNRVTVFTTNSNLDEDLDVPVDQPVMVDGVEVWYFRRQDPIKKYLPWLKYVSQSMGYLFTPAIGDALRRKLPDVDIVHSQMPFVYPTWIAGRRALAANKPLFYNQRGVFHPMRLRYRGLKKKIYIDLMEKPIMRRASGLIALTPEEVDSYRALGMKTACHVIPNGIDVRDFRREARSDALSDFGISDSQQVILFLGRLHSVKGADLLMEAFARIAQRHPDSVLVLAGPDEDNIVGTLQSLASTQSLAHRVFLTGMVSGEQKLDLLGRANLFVLPSMGEGLSMAVLEALASGTPVILSPECNLPIVEQAGAGLVVERDADRLAGAISQLLTDPEALKIMGERAYALARDQFGWPAILNRLEALYQDAIITPRTAPSELTASGSST